MRTIVSRCMAGSRQMRGSRPCSSCGSNGSAGGLQRPAVQRRAGRPRCSWAARPEPPGLLFDPIDLGRPALYTKQIIRAGSPVLSHHLPIQDDLPPRRFTRKTKMSSAMPEDLAEIVRGVPPPGLCSPSLPRPALLHSSLPGSSWRSHSAGSSACRRARQELLLLPSGRPTS